MSGHPPKIIIAGAPASGKGTQCENIKAKYNCIHLSTGDILRAAVVSKSSLGIEAEGYMNAGKLVPDQLIINMVISRLKEHDCMEIGWLLDGFPRSVGQAEALMNAGFIPDVFILLDVPDNLLIERVVGRRSDPVTSKIYHLKYNPPPENEEVIKRLVHRSDDTEEKALVRIEAFHQNLSPILSVYDSKMLRVDGSRTPQDIWNELQQKIPRFILYQVVFVIGGPGSGKGTVSAMISKELDYVHFNIGDLLRHEADHKSHHEHGGREVEVIAKAMRASGSRKFLLDGFPYSVDSATDWYKVMGTSTIVDCVLHLNCSVQTMKERSPQVPNDGFDAFFQHTTLMIDKFDHLGKLRVIDAELPKSIVAARATRLLRGVKLIPPYHRTLGMVKANRSGDFEVPTVLATVQGGGLSVISARVVIIDFRATTGFEKLAGKDRFSRRFQQFIEQGPVMILVIEGANAIDKWKTLIGPKNCIEPSLSNRSVPVEDDSSHSHFIDQEFLLGRECYGSDTDYRALLDLDFWLDPKGIGCACREFSITSLRSIEVEDTFAMIKPITAEMHHDEVISIITAHGFTIVAELHYSLTLEQAKNFYAEHKMQPFFEDLCTYMCSGPVIAIHLRLGSGSSAITAWRHLIGPTYSYEAKASRPDSIRAVFGLDVCRNACHGSSDSHTVAKREISFFFTVGEHSNHQRYHDLQQQLPQQLQHNYYHQEQQHAAVDVSPQPVHPSKKKITREDIPVMEAYSKETLQPLMSSLMQKLLVERPDDPAGFTISELSAMRELRNTPTLAPIRK